MSGMLRPVAPLFLSALFAVPVLAQDATFEEGVDLMRRGRDEEALTAFQRVLASEPSSEEAYELWQTTDHQVWLDMLSKQGEWELIAKRFMALSSQARAERSSDPDAIRALLRQLNSEDVLEYRTALRTLASEHGEYAVPHMLAALADQVDDDRRVRTMQGLSEMGDDVVLPLNAALASSDAFLRRNVALTLGYIGDSRSAPGLAWLAQADSDPGVRAAASQALEKCGGGQALDGFLQQGDDYHLRRVTVLRPHQHSDVVWSWDGASLVSHEVPGFLYSEELAAAAFHHALEAEPGSARAMAGLARVASSENGRIERRDDADEFEARVAGNELTLLASGSAVLDRALMEALTQDDELAAVGLCRTLQGAAQAPTTGLQRAVGHPSSASVRAEAAVALANAASRARATVSSDVVAALTDAVERQVLRIAVVIDGDGQRGTGLVSALQAEGFSVSYHARGTAGLSGLYRLPGADLILLADRLPDLTSDQVLSELRRNPATSETPVVLISRDPAGAADSFGDRVAGAISSAADVSTAVEAAGSELGPERDLANQLAGRAAHSLARLAQAGTDISPACGGLGGMLSGRPDDVTAPAVKALALAGGVAEVQALANLMADGERADELRVAAGHALAHIFARDPRSGSEVVGTLQETLGSDASLALRRSAAAALGQLELSAELRTDLLRSIRTGQAEN